ncbi:MAG: sulfotransferase [Enhydrobacter sp.]|nr:sulfotransferase [Enhydrobacter sp.]
MPVHVSVDRTFHFISGLPRAGSTLLAAILRQNPRFHAAMSSPIAALFDGIVAQVSAGTELAAMVDEAQRARLLRGLFESYYAEHPQAVIFDTNRAWTAQLSALLRLFPAARVICCVRDVAWVMDSLERLYRANAFDHTRLFGTPAERSTVYTRVEALAHADRLVGYAWHALREACYSERADRIVIVEYDLLVRRPAEVLALLYEFLGEASFTHDFARVEYDAPRFDAQLGLDGLHRVQPQVAPLPRQTILPPDLFQRYTRLSFWRDLKDSKAFRIVAQPDGERQGDTMPESPRAIAPQAP